MVEQQSPTQPLSIAIIGGGITGVVLTIALQTHSPHIRTTLYESASSFREIGAGVGFQPNFVRTMSLIDPRIAAAFEKCRRGNVDTDRWFTVRVGDVRKANEDGVVCEGDGGEKVRLDEELFVIPGREGMGRGVHRAQFLDELVKLVPEGITKFKKRLVDVVEAGDGSGNAVLSFADGTTEGHSAVLGCDGIHSRTRSIVLGDVEAATPVFTGKYCYRCLMPMSRAVELLGEERTSTSQMYLGYSGHVATFPIANGTILNAVAFSSRPTWPDSKWVVQSSREDMLQDFENWSPAVRSIMENVQTPYIWALFNHPPAAGYYTTEPLICLVGDAAHASTPHQGSGAGMCIEDVYILSGLLSRCKTTSDLESAFYAFDFVRRPRTQRLVKTSREAGMLWGFEGEGVGDNLQEFMNNALERMSWIWDHEISEDLERALKLLKSSAPTAWK